jgi:hypothetical protein
MTRRQQATENTLGYVTGTRRVTVYLADEQGIDVGGCKYAIVCDEHGDLWGANTRADAEDLMRHPDEWCLPCETAKYGDRSRQATA